MKSSSTRGLVCPAPRVGGATTVEFALSAMFLFTLMFGLVDFSRWLYAINSAVEATRWGARIAAVCAQNAPGVTTRMLTWLPPGTTAANITVSYPAGMVKVVLTNVPFTPVTWILPGSYNLPPLATTLPRESMTTSFGAYGSNPDCT
jgi:hypothetical protein